MSEVTSEKISEKFSINPLTAAFEYLFKITLEPFYDEYRKVMRAKSKLPSENQLGVDARLTELYSEFEIKYVEILNTLVKCLETDPPGINKEGTRFYIKFDDTTKKILESSYFMGIMGEYSVCSKENIVKGTYPNIEKAIKITKYIYAVNFVCSKNDFDENFDILDNRGDIITKINSVDNGRCSGNSVYSGDITESIEQLKTKYQEFVNNVRSMQVSPTLDSDFNISEEQYKTLLDYINKRPKIKSSVNKFVKKLTNKYGIPIIVAIVLCIMIYYGNSFVNMGSGISNSISNGISNGISKSGGWGTSINPSTMLTLENGIVDRSVGASNLGAYTHPTQMQTILEEVVEELGGVLEVASDAWGVIDPSVGSAIKESTKKLFDTTSIQLYRMAVSQKKTVLDNILIGGNYLGDVKVYVELEKFVVETLFKPSMFNSEIDTVNFVLGAMQYDKINLVNVFNLFMDVDEVNDMVNVVGINMPTDTYLDTRYKILSYLHKAVTHKIQELYTDKTVKNAKAAAQLLNYLHSHAIFSIYDQYFDDGLSPDFYKNTIKIDYYNIKTMDEDSIEIIKFNKSIEKTFKDVYNKIRDMKGMRDSSLSGSFQDIYADNIRPYFPIEKR